MSIKPKKTIFSRSKVPLEILAGKTDMAKKIGTQAVWNNQDRLQGNYVANGLMADANAGFGRNAAEAHPLQEKTAEIEGGAEADESDDDLRQVEGKRRRDGRRAELSKPTTHQQQILERLIQEHGEDLEAMVKDRKLNSMLLPASKLRKLIEGYKHYGKDGRCQFRTPIKHL